MTPKQKAEELVEKYHKEYDLLFWDLSWIQAKQCSLIAVDELINETNKFFEAISQNRLSFWQQVKTEIEKL
jgi:hypothetical protein